MFFLILLLFSYFSFFFAWADVVSGLPAEHWDIIPYSGFPKMPICFPVENLIAYMENFALQKCYNAP